jgi:DNA invertase Pin-like site-specific DNA recombinase
LKFDCYLNPQGVDTATPAGNTMVQMVGALAEFERVIIQEWVRAGACTGKASGEAARSAKRSTTATQEDQEIAERSAVGYP